MNKKTDLSVKFTVGVDFLGLERAEDYEKIMDACKQALGDFTKPLDKLCKSTPVEVPFGGGSAKLEVTHLSAKVRALLPGEKTEYKIQITHGNSWENYTRTSPEGTQFIPLFDSPGKADKEVRDIQKEYSKTGMKMPLHTRVVDKFTEPDLVHVAKTPMLSWSEWSSWK